jgi:ABC-type sugar transport system ATPase subunit
MDEPTAALSAKESELLRGVVRDLAASGTAIVYISHFLSEILDLSDEVTIMRNSRIVRTSATSEETPQRIVEGMLGRSFDAAFPERTHSVPDSPVVLEAERLGTRTGLHDFSLTVRAGEIVGIGGLMGSGRSEALRALFGADELTDGAIRLNGKEITLRGPRDAVRAGIAMISESRQHDGLVLMMAPSRNVSLPHLRSVSRASVINRSDELHRTGEILSALDVRGKLDGPVRSMSGGNQQKVMFGRWLFERPAVLLIDEPTRGVDIGAKFEIYRLINELAADGVAIVVVSSDLEELLGLAHVIHVMHKSTIVDSFPAETATEHSIMQAAFGLTSDVPA